MSDRAPDAVLRSPGAARVRDFLRSADALNGNPRLDGDQIARLCRDLSSIESFSEIQASRYEFDAMTTSRHRQQDARLQRSMLQQEYRRLDAELDRIRTRSAEADGRRVDDAVRLQEAATRYEEEQAEHASLSEMNRHLQSYPPFFGTDTGSSMQSGYEYASTSLEETGRWLEELRERARDSAEEAGRLRSELAAAQAAIDDLRNSPNSGDETDTEAGTASDAMADLHAAKNFCSEMCAFLEARSDDISGEELVTRLDGPIETFPDDGPRSTTGRAALERLVRLAEDQG